MLSFLDDFITIDFSVVGIDFSDVDPSSLVTFFSVFLRLAMIVIFVEVTVTNVLEIRRVSYV